MNGGSGVQKCKKNYGDEGMKNVENDNRKFSVKDFFPMKSLTPSSPNRRRSSAMEKNGNSATDSPVVTTTVSPVAAVIASSKVPDDDDDAKEDADSTLPK